MGIGNCVLGIGTVDMARHVQKDQGSYRAVYCVPALWSYIRRQAYGVRIPANYPAVEMVVITMTRVMRVIC